MKFRHIRSSTRGHTRIRYNLYAINEKYSPEKHTCAYVRMYVHTRKKIHRTELYEDKAINMCADKVRIQRNDVKHSHFIVIINNSVFILVCACALKFIGTNECSDASSFFDSFFFFTLLQYKCMHVLRRFLFPSCDELCLVLFHDKRKYHLSQFRGV